MSSEWAIKAENLGKSYTIRHQSGGSYVALRDVLSDGARRAGRRVVRPRGMSQVRSANPSREEFWALRDVSFTVQPGERVGIIGRNGAGKSTLLKVLSRITEPTSGRLGIRGRVASLLEVGTGFHPELTGRENIYLNGAVLGMHRAEIKRKFDEIVDFAEVEKFLDTPVKRYSSGMYVRLAFAVAAHLEPEILIVDEVLAVGDASFQRKCLGKMSTSAEAGRAILLVSHQLNQIRRLCDWCIWMDVGSIRTFGPTLSVLASYESAMSARDAQREVDSKEGETQFLRWDIVDPESDNHHAVSSHGTVTVRFMLRVAAPIRRGHHGISLFSQEGQLIWATAVDSLVLEAGVHELTYTFPSLPLKPAPYQWHLSIVEDDERLDDWYACPELLINAPPITHPHERFQGMLNLPWTFASHPL